MCVYPGSLPAGPCRTTSSQPHVTAAEQLLCFCSPAAAAEPGWNTPPPKKYPAVMPPSSLPPKHTHIHKVEMCLPLQLFNISATAAWSVPPVVPTCCRCFMPSSSSVSPPDGGRRGAAEEGGGGGRLEEATTLGPSWVLEPPTGATSDTNTRRKNISKTIGPIFSIFYLWENGVECWGGGVRATYWLCILYSRNSRFSKQDIKWLGKHIVYQTKISTWLNFPPTHSLS